MNYDEPEDFIRVYDNAISKEFCRGAIDYFEWCLQNNKTWDRGNISSLSQKDVSTTLNPTTFWDITFSTDNLGGYISEFNDVFWNQCYTRYSKEFETLNNYAKHSIFTYKIQKTIPSGGYHVWHSEKGTIDLSKRIATYVVYLNDVVEGGETEFLYQRKRVVPREGSIVIFPAAYTHTHRGNPPLRGVKYIMTGWIEFG